MSYRCFLFDLDGTLLDTREAICRSYEHLFEKYPCNRPCRSQLFSDIGLPLHEVLALYFVGAGASELRQMAEEYRVFQREQCQDAVAPFPGIQKVLEDLVTRGIICGVVTGRGERSTRELLSLTGIEKYMSVCVALEHTARHKPHPEPLLHALWLLSLHTSDGVLYTGDSEWDIEAGLACGMATALALWGCEERRFFGLMPRYSLEHPSELLRLSC